MFYSKNLYFLLRNIKILKIFSKVEFFFFIIINTFLFKESYM